MTAKPVANKVEAVAVELRLDRMSRLYNSLDPAPFHEKELDAAADDYIVGSAEDLGGREMRLVIMLPRSELARPEASHIAEFDPQPLRLARARRASAPARRMEARPPQPGDRAGFPGRLPVRPRTAGALGVGGVARSRRGLADRRLGGPVGPDRAYSFMAGGRSPAGAGCWRAWHKSTSRCARSNDDQKNWGPFISTSPTTMTKAAATRRRPNGSPSSKVPIKAPNSTDVSRSAAMCAIGPRTSA